MSYKRMLDELKDRVINDDFYEITIENIRRLSKSDLVLTDADIVSLALQFYLVYLCDEKDRSEVK